MATPVLVAVDGSPGSLKALDFAVSEAALRHRPLVVYHTFIMPVDVPDFAISSSPRYQEATEDQRTAARRLVDAVVTRATDKKPGLPVTGEVADAIAAGAAIIERSADCELVVVGSRGRGGFADLLLGSTSAQVAVHTHCPTVVVRPSQGERGPYAGKVLVGVDDSSQSQPAVAFAFDEASRRGVDLVAVHVTPRPVPGRTDAERLASEEARMLSEALAGWQERYPDVTVAKVVRPGSPRRLLCELSAGAALLAVGSHGRGGFTGMVFGSTSLAVLHHARVPVAVVRR